MSNDIDKRLLEYKKVRHLLPSKNKALCQRFHAVSGTSGARGVKGTTRTRTKRMRHGHLTYYTNNGKTPVFGTIRRLGGKKDSADSEAYVVCPLKNNKCSTDVRIALKNTPLKQYEKDLLLSHKKELGSLNELYILKKTTELFLQGKTNYLPILYGAYFCKKAHATDYANQNIVKNYKSAPLMKKFNASIKDINDIIDILYNNHIFETKRDELLSIARKQQEVHDFLTYMLNSDFSLSILTELAYKDLGNFLSQNLFSPSFLSKHSYEHLSHVLISIIEQTIMGLYILHNHLNVAHLDIHMGNILVMGSKEQGLYKYIHKEYGSVYISHVNFYVLIWDYGRALIVPPSARDTREVRDTRDTRAVRDLLETFYAKYKHEFASFFTENEARLTALFYSDSSSVQEYLIDRLFLMDYYMFFQKYSNKIHRSLRGAGTSGARTRALKNLITILDKGNLIFERALTHDIIASNATSEAHASPLVAPLINHKNVLRLILRKPPSKNDVVYNKDKPIYI